MMDYMLLLVGFFPIKMPSIQKSALTDCVGGLYGKLFGSRSLYGVINRL